MNDTDRKKQREAWEDKHYIKQITCPEHPLANHKAKLFCEGHRFAGQWECPKGFEDSHDHEAAFDAGLAEREVEEGEVDTMTNGEHDTYTSRYYICGGEEGCGVQLDGDPDADAADDLADMQADEMRDNDV